MTNSGEYRDIFQASKVNRFGKFQFIYRWYLVAKAPQELASISEIFTGFKTRIDMDVNVLAPDDLSHFEVFELFNPGINVGLTAR